MTTIDWANAFTTKKPTIRIVADELCPSCRREGSPKVCDENGDWHWKCLSSYDDCKIAYWLPGSTYIEHKLTPDKEAQLRKEVADRITAQMADRIWICNCDGSGISTARTIPNTDPVPTGWHTSGEGCN